MAFPNDEQNIVIEHTGKPLVVVAGPGTGKTKTLITRMERLLLENPNRNVSFITFTRTSRKDTERKVKENVGEEALEKAKYDLPRISTLHTYAKSIVHRYAYVIGREPDFSILIEDRGEKTLVISELLKDLRIDISVDILEKEITYYRNTQKLSDKCPFTEVVMKRILDYFENLLNFYNTFDMDGIVPAACAIITTKPSELPPMFLQVDEYQDLNPIDQKLVELINNDLSSQIVVVGDDAQSVYGLRNANPSGMQELWNSDKWEHVYFSECHRLPPHILRASQALISKFNYLGGMVKLPEDDGKRILTLQCSTNNIQIEAVAKLIGTIKNSKTHNDGSELSNKDFMILCPTSTVAVNVAKILQDKFNIGTKTREKKLIPDDHWLLLLVLRMLHTKDSLAIRQWLEIIHILPEEIEQYRLEALKTGVSLFDYCSKLQVDSIKEIFVHLKRLSESLNDIDLFRKELLEFPNLLIEDTLFPEIGITLNDVTKSPNSIGTIIRLIHEKFGLLDTENAVTDDDKILVTTLYSAKGLESDFVFILRLNSTFMPFRDRNIDEEHRVLYVALTRAKQDVIITFDEIFDQKNKRRLKNETMSPFLREIESHLNIKRILIKDLNELNYE